MRLNTKYGIAASIDAKTDRAGRPDLDTATVVDPELGSYIGRPATPGNDGSQTRSEVRLDRRYRSLKHQVGIQND